MGSPNDFDGPLVREHINKAAEFIRRESYRDFVEHMNDFMAIDSEDGARFDSPLELVFLTWWLALSRVDHSVGHVLDYAFQEEVEMNGHTVRLDFLIYPNELEVSRDVRWSHIVVELDGHEFHEKTRKQVARRNWRDRLLQKAGWKVFHFSYVEMVSDPLRCVREVADYALKTRMEIVTNKAVGFGRVN